MTTDTSKKTEAITQIDTGARRRLGRGGTVASAAAASVALLLAGAGAGSAFGAAAAAAADENPHDTGNGYVMVEDNGPAWIAPKGTTAQELREREWFVREEGGIFYYEKHNWQEQRRVAEHRFLRTVTHAAVTEEVPVYREWSEHQFEIQRPYWTVESKQIRLPENPPASLLNWLEQIGADYHGDGWWHLPYAVVNGIPGFNPITVPDTGYLNTNVYGGPNITVWYSKTEVVLSSPGTSPYAVQQNQQLFWDGSWWTADRSQAAWIAMEDAPYAAQLLDSREHREQIGTETVVVEPERTETFYATADGESTDQADAAWLTESPGAQWTAFGERRLAEWDDAAEWHQVIGRDWALGRDPGPQPDYYDGYDSETQRFRPVIDAWKLTLMEEPVDPGDPVDPVDPGTEDPAVSPEDPTIPAEPGADPADPTVPEPPADQAEPEAEQDATAFETGGAAGDGGLGAPAIAGLVAAGVLVAGGITVPYLVTRRRKAAAGQR